MLNLRSKRTLDYIWNRLADWATGGNGVLANPLTTGLIIDEALTIYVETTGDDANDGSLAKPFRTIQGALDWLRPFTIQAPVVVQVGIGTFDGFNIPAIKVERAGKPGGTTVGTLTIQGTWIDPVLTTGTSSGTATSVSFATVNDTGQNWTPNELQGMMVPFSSGTYFVVKSNTATSFSLVGGHTPTSAYTIKTFGTVVYQNVTTTGSVTKSGATFEANSGGGIPGNSSGGVTVRALKFVPQDANSYYGVYVGTQGVVAVAECRFDINNTSPSGAVGIVVGGGRISIARNFFYLTRTSGTSTGMSVTGGTCSGGGANYFLGTGVATQTGLSCATPSAGFESPSAQLFESLGVGGSFVRCQPAWMGGTWIGCTTAVSITSTVGVVVNSTSNLPNWPYVSSGNTTFLSASVGSKVQVSSAIASGVGTTDINVDGATSTLAAMRALSPKAFPATPNVYGTVVYE